MNISGHVSKYKTGNWMYRGRGPEGEFRKTGYSTRRLAQEALDKRLSGYRTYGGLTGRLTVSEWAKIWIKTIAETKKATTRSNYAMNLRLHVLPVIGSMALEDITEESVREVYRKMAAAGRATSYIAGVHAILDGMLTAAVRERKMHRNPCDNVLPPRGAPARARKTWSFDELQLVIKTIYGRPDAAFWLLWVTAGGLRRGEICGIREQSVDQENMRIRIEWQRTVDPETGKIIEGTPKTQKSVRWIYPDSHVMELIAALPKQDPCALCGEPHIFGDINPKNLGYYARKLADEAGVRRITPHEIRHTFGTRTAQEHPGLIKELSVIMGHSSVKTTLDLYVHPDDSQLRELNAHMSRKILGTS